MVPRSDSPAALYSSSFLLAQSCGLKYILARLIFHFSPKIRRNARLHNPNVKTVYLAGYIADHRANVTCICSVNINQLNAKMLTKRPFTTEGAFKAGSIELT